MHLLRASVTSPHPYPDPNPNPDPNPDQAGTQQAVTAVQAHGAAMEQLATARYREM